MPYIVVTKSQKVKKRKKVVKIASFMLILLLILSILIILNTYWKSTLPTLLDITQAKISAQTVLVINQAVTTSFQDTDVFGDLISIQRDNDGNIILLTANSLQANKLARQTAIVGTISGIPLFSEMGPEITITVTPIGAVNCTFTSTFESVGINQTLHRMFIQVECKMDLIIPQMHHTMECVVPILVSESIIIGKVPQTYLNGGLVVGGGNSV